MSSALRALALSDRGRMEVRELPPPDPRPGQVVVEVKVSAVNEMDVQVRGGGWTRQVRAFRKAGPVLTGFEFAGVVRSDGRRVRAGDRVLGYVHVLNGPRTHAQLICVDENDLGPMPEGLSDEDGAALVVMGLTASEILERLKPLGAGRTCLVVGAAGGVGAYSVQLAAHQGARVTAVCSEANADWVRAQGAAEVRAYETEPALKPGDRFDLVVDAPAKLSFGAAAPFLARDGMYVTTNPTADPAGFVRAAFSPKSAGWLMMLTTSPAKLRRLTELWAEGALRPVIDSVHDLTGADAAFDRFAARGKQGRVLLRVSP